MAYTSTAFESGAGAGASRSVAEVFGGRSVADVFGSGGRSAADYIGSSPSCAPTPRPRDYTSLTNNPLVFVDIEIDRVNAGQMLFELFGRDCPRTVENFRALCTGEAGRGLKTGRELTYEGCPFHRIIPGFMAQGGDFERGDRSGGESIYGGDFADEAFVHKHHSGGMLSMANSGPHTNGSQFFLTFRESRRLDKKHAVFGRMVEGAEVLRRIEQCGRKDGDPRRKVVIIRCGEKVPESIETSHPSRSRDSRGRYRSHHRSHSRSRDRSDRRRSRSHSRDLSDRRSRSRSQDRSDRHRRRSRSRTDRDVQIAVGIVAVVAVRKAVTLHIANRMPAYLSLIMGITKT